MRNPIENLRDYNEVRLDLQEAGGSKDALYKKIGETAVAEEIPELLAIGGVIATTIIGLIYASYRGLCFWKNRKQKIENEPALKREFDEAIKVATSEKNEEFKDSDGII